MMATEKEIEDLRGIMEDCREVMERDRRKYQLSQKDFEDARKAVRDVERKYKRDDVIEEVRKPRPGKAGRSRYLWLVSYGEFWDKFKVVKKDGTPGKSYANIGHGSILRKVGRMVEGKTVWNKGEGPK
jgi:hypothetical protein